MAESSRLFEEADVGFGKLKLAVADVSDDLALCWLCVLYKYNTCDVSIQRRQGRCAACVRACVRGNEDALHINLDGKKTHRHDGGHGGE